MPTNAGNLRAIQTSESMLEGCCFEVLGVNLGMRRDRAS